MYHTNRLFTCCFTANKHHAKKNPLLNKHSLQHSGNKMRTILSNRGKVIIALEEGHAIVTKTPREDQSKKKREAAIKEIQNEIMILSSLKQDPMYSRTCLIVKLAKPTNTLITTNQTANRLFLQYQEMEADLYNIIFNKANFYSGYCKAIKEQERYIFQQLAQALSVLYQNEIIHADIKPENILLKAKPNGQVRIQICDFGHACFFNDITNRYKNTGTLYYRPPEVVLNKRLHQLSDVWSLGAVFYFIHHDGQDFLQRPRKNNYGTSYNNEKQLFKKFNEDPKKLRTLLTKKNTWYTSTPVKPKIITNMLRMNPEDRSPPSQLLKQLSRS